MNSLFFTRWSVLAAATGLLLTACAEQPETTVEEESSGQSQVFARVGDEELTLRMVQAAIEGRANPTEAVIERAKQDLIDQTALKQKALALRLDRTPEVLSQLILARDRVLARAALETFSPNLGNVSEAEIELFISENAQGFQDRIFYLFNSYSVRNENLPTERHDALEELGGIDAIVAQLESEGMTVTPQPFSRYAHQMPRVVQAQLPQLAETGEVFFVVNGPITQFMAIERVITVPLSTEQKEDLARRAIEERSRQAQLDAYRSELLAEVGVERLDETTGIPTPQQEETDGSNAGEAGTETSTNSEVTDSSETEN